MEFFYCFDNRFSNLCPYRKYIKLKFSKFNFIFEYVYDNLIACMFVQSVFEISNGFCILNNLRFLKKITNLNSMLKMNKKQ